MKQGLSVENISKEYHSPHGPMRILDDISFRVNPGSFIALLGPSGCGKTTLLNIIAGFLKPTSGRIVVDGKNIVGPGSDRVMIFQSDSVFPWMSVENNIRFGLKNKGLSSEEMNKRIRFFLELVGLQDFAHYYPKQLSGGMRKRVDVARAFAINPPYILADEPFGSLDSKTKLNLQLEIMKLWEVEKNTIIFVTHDVEEAIFLSDRIFLLSSKPTNILEVIDISFPRPRVIDLIVSREFQEIRKAVNSKYL